MISSPSPCRKKAVLARHSEKKECDVKSKKPSEVLTRRGGNSVTRMAASYVSRVRTDSLRFGSSADFV